MEILIKCHTKDHLNLNELTEFQGELKNLSDERYQKLKKQILELGFSAPFFVWRNEGKNLLCDGHQRARTLKVMEQEGAFVPPLPVVFIDAKDKKEAKKKVLAFTSQYGQMTEQGLSDFAIDAGLNLADITDNFNFPEINLDKFNIGDGEYDAQCDEDEVPEVVEPRANLGDIWQLGEHRLMCGDSTDKATVEKLMDGAVPNIMMTDPPYGVKLDQSWRDKALGDKALGKGNNKIVANDDRADWTEVWENFSGNIAYVWHAGKFTDVVMESLRSAGLEPSQQLIWNKSVMVMGRSDYHFKHEPCWYAIRKNKPHDWIGDRKQTTIIDAAPPNHIMGGSKEEKTEHPTQKPVACMELILNHSGDVYDPFGGSGSTLIACEKTNRKCYMMELDPSYCDVIVARYVKYSGNENIFLNGEPYIWKA